MDADRWQRMWDLYHGARKHPAQERKAFLAEECPDDPALVDEVLALLSRRPPGGFLENGPLADDGDDDPLLGQTLERFVVEQVLGEGGMGKVYLARETGALQRPVALKVVRRGLDTERIMRRFRAEQETLARLQHPAIAAVHQAGITADGRPWFAMEYVDGVSITDYCRDRELSLEPRLRLFARVCAGVQYTHQKGVIHRDLKPSNILVASDEAIKLIDFGIARAIQTDADASRMTRQGQVIGTPEYMSPEQAADSGDVDTRSDIYSLGVVLYELLTGERPFGALRGAALTEALRTQDPPTPSQRITAAEDGRDPAVVADPARWRRRIEGDLDWVVMKALAREPGERYSSAAALAADLRHVLANEPVQARPPSRVYLMGKFIRRHPFGVAAGLATTAALIALSITLWIRGNELDRALTTAVQERQRAEQIAAFMTETFTAADPYEHGKEEVTARDLLASGRERAEALEADPVVRGVLLTTIANTHRRLGELDLSESAAQAALLALDGVDTRPAREARAEALASLATLAREQARFDAVVDYSQQALELRRQLFGERSVEAASSMAQLGYGWLKLGDYDEAEPLLARAVELHEQHPEAEELPPYVHLASLYVTQGRYADAEPLYRKTLAQSIEINGPDHPETATRENNLAALYYRMGDHERAAEHYEKALAIQRSNVDDLHPNVLTVMNNLGALYVRMEAFDKAQPLLSQALAGRRATLGPDHLEVGVTAYHLANTRRGLGELEGAESLYREARAIMAGAVGGSDRRIGVVLNGLARLQLQAGKLAEAEATAREALAINTAGWPEGHRTPGESRLILAEIILQRGNPETAENEARAALEVFEGDAGSAFEAARTRGLLGRILQQAGRPQEAAPLLQQALSELEALRGPNHPSLAPIRTALAAAGSG